MNVLVTGSASGFAQLLLARLAADPAIEQMTGVDGREGNFTHERFGQVIVDLRSPLLANLLRNVQALIHLAPATSDAAAARGEMLESTQSLYTHAQATGTTHLIHLSSALVYNPRTENSIDEQQALGAPPGCAAAEALQAVETWLDEFESTYPTQRLLRLRPHWLLGRHSDSVLARLLRQRLTLRDVTAHLQCVHEDDVVEAILRSVHSTARGAFNLACQDNVTLPAMHQQARWIRLPATPRRLAQRLDTAPGCIDALTRSLVIDSTRARSELGWRPRYDSVREILRHA
jgi:UDP-glucose 4-epimerase